MIDNRVIGDMWSAKSEGKEKVVDQSRGEKRTWTAIVSSFHDSGGDADIVSLRRVPSRDPVSGFVCALSSERSGGH